MIKLKDVMKTKYITDNHTGELLKVLDQAEKDGELIDLASCKFMVVAERVLGRYYGKVEFCNSVDQELDAILKHNNKAIKDRGMITAVPLRIDTLKREEDIITYLKTFDKTKVYSLENCKVNKLKCLSLAIIITIKGPDVMFDLREFASDFFRQVRIDWLKYKKPHTKYNEVIGAAIVLRDVIDGKVYKPGVGWLNEDLFVKEYNVLPYEFGTEHLNESDEFREVWKNAIANLVSTLGETKTMKDFIEVID